MRKIMLVFGTRPEAIKMCPLVKELQKYPKQFQTIVCVSGQHREMLAQVLSCFQVVPDYNLDIMKPGQDLYDITSNVMLGMRELLQKEKPDIVLVHGDTTTSFAAALSAFYAQIPVGHIEAGLRTYNLSSPYPEEWNRQGIGILAKWHFAPTKKAEENLLKEGKDKDHIFVTGNTGIDAMKYTIRKDYHADFIDWVKDSRLIVVTAHRRENLGAPLRAIFEAILEIVDEFKDVKVIYPVHKNPKVALVAQEMLGGNDRIRLIEPMEVMDFHNLLNQSYLIMSDSGGIQEEAPALGKPVLVMRDTTERPEGVQAGTLRLVGTQKENIVKNARELLTNAKEYDKMSSAANPYGDGHASERIVSILKEQA